MADWVNSVTPLAGVILGASLTHYGERGKERRGARTAALSVVARIEGEPAPGVTNDQDLAELRASLAAAGVALQVYRCVWWAIDECQAAYKSLRLAGQIAQQQDLPPPLHPLSLSRVVRLISHVLEVELIHPWRARVGRKERLQEFIQAVDQLHDDHFSMRPD